jgi:hypothetical protein
VGKAQVAVGKGVAVMTIVLISGVGVFEFRAALATMSMMVPNR